MVFPFLARRFLFIILLLAAGSGWVVYLLGENFTGNELPANAGQAQHLLALQKQYDDLRSDHDSLIMERTALLTLNENLQQVIANATSSDGEIDYSLSGFLSRFPGGEPEYLKQRLGQAKRQLRYHRARKKVADAALEQAKQEKINLEQQLDIKVAQLEGEYAAERESLVQTVEQLSSELEQLTVAISNEQSPQPQAASETAGAQTTNTTQVESSTPSEAPASTTDDRAEHLEQQVFELREAMQVAQAAAREAKEAANQAEEQTSALTAAEVQIASLQEQLQDANQMQRQIAADNERLKSRHLDQGERFDEQRTLYEKTIEVLANKLEQAVSANSATVANNGAAAGTEDMAQDMDTGDAPQDEPVEQLASITQSSEQDAKESAQVQPATQQPATEQTIQNASDTAADDDAGVQPSERDQQLQQQLGELQQMLEKYEADDVPLQLAQATIDDLNRQLQSEADKTRLVEQTLRQLTEQVSALEIELDSANQRTQNMESMAQAMTEENRRFGELVNQLQDSLGLTIAEKNSQISEIHSDYRVIEYSTDILFQSGSSVLSEPGKQVLKELSAVLDQDVSDSRIISFEGHTDNVPIKGTLAQTYPTNWELSLARAATATRFMIEQGLSATRVRAVGYGSSRPVASNDTPQGRSANRRIEVHLVPELEKVQN